MNEQYEDTVVKIKTYDKAIQKAWDLMSRHNSGLLLENYELKERLQNRSVLTLIRWKIQGLFRSKYERE
jgi:hypothetical protein